MPVLQDVPECRKWAGASARRRVIGPRRRSKWTRRLDKVFLHPFFGPLVFLAVVVAVVSGIFSVAAPLPDLVTDLFDDSGKVWLVSVIPESLFRSLLIDGAWRGVGSVLAFLPQILLSVSIHRHCWKTPDICRARR